MKSYWRIWQYAWLFKREIIFSAVSNVLMVIFSLVSITALIPILQLMFEGTQVEANPVVWSGWSNLRDWLEGNMQFQLRHYETIWGKPKLLARILWISAGLMLLKNLFRYLANAALVIVRNGIEKEMRKDLYGKLLDLPPGYFADQRKGDLLTRLTTDIQEVQWALLSSVQRLIQDPLMIVLTLGALLLLSSQLTAFVFVLLPIAGFIITSLGRTLKKPAKRSKEVLGRVLSLIDEHLMGLPVIQSFNAEKQASAIFDRENASYYKEMNTMQWLNQLASPMSELLGSLVIIATIWYGGVLIFENKGLEAAIFITYIALFYQVINPAKSIATAMYDIRRGTVSAERIWEVMDTTNPVQSPSQPIPAPQSPLHIRFENVSFRYEEQWVLRNIDFEVAPGQMVALVGTSGSGKSTLAALLNRFYDPQEGRITINGIDIKEMDLMDLRQMLGYIHQQPFIFNDTVRANALLGNEHSDMPALESAAQKAHAYTFIQDLPEGWETIVGDRGGKLSGGQQQRLAMIRLFLKDAPIVILDEATAALDAESEQSIQTALDQMMHQKTMLIIAHRLSTVQHADQIIVLSDGKITEKGTHTSLVQADGQYAAFVRLQHLS